MVLNGLCLQICTLLTVVLLGFCHRHTLCCHIEMSYSNPLPPSFTRLESHSRNWVSGARKGLEKVGAPELKKWPEKRGLEDEGEFLRNIWFKNMNVVEQFN